MDNNQTPQIPDFAQPPLPNATSAVPPTSVVPPTVSGGAPGGSKKRLGFILAIVIAVAIPVISYFVYTNKQTVNSEASTNKGCVVNLAPNGRQCQDPPPLRTGDQQQCPPIQKLVLVQCRDGQYRCTEQGSTFDVCGDNCKRINPCQLKCRDDNGLERFVDTCQSEATPTPQKTQLCEEPLLCVDPSTAAQTGCISAAASAPMPASCSKPGTIDSGFCCKPKITNTPSPTMTLTPTMSPTPTMTVTPSPTPGVCVSPKIEVEVQCLTCGDQQ